MSAITEPVTLYRMSLPEHECPWGLKAVALLKERDIPFTDVKLTNQAQVDDFMAQHQVPTTPQIFFGKQRIGGYTDLAHYLHAPVVKENFSYIPLIAVFSVATLMALALQIGWMGLMGIALCLLALLKLMDIPSFVKGFKQYDLVTQRLEAYAWSYPFLEVLLGLSFLAGKGLALSGPVALVIGVIGTTSVIKAVYIDKLAINCACVGGNSKTPLGVSSLAENLMMVLMGSLLLLKL